MSYHYGYAKKPTGPAAQTPAAPVAWSPPTPDQPAPTATASWATPTMGAFKGVNTDPDRGGPSPYAPRYTKDKWGKSTSTSGAPVAISTTGRDAANARMQEMFATLPMGGDFDPSVDNMSISLGPGYKDANYTIKNFGYIGNLYGQSVAAQGGTASYDGLMKFQQEMADLGWYDMSTGSMTDLFTQLAYQQRVGRPDPNAQNPAYQYGY